MVNEEPSMTAGFRNRLDTAKNYAEIWKIVKDTVRYSLHRRRDSLMLFLDDLPIQLGAYHSLGTNNIVLNRRLVQIVEGAIQNKQVINALVYNLLVHEYLHTLGESSEPRVRRMVVEVAQQCFGADHSAVAIARKSPWALLKGIPLEVTDAPRRVMEIVKNFEKTDRYVV